MAAGGASEAGGTVLAPVLVARVGCHVADGSAPPVSALAAEVRQQVLARSVTPARPRDTLVDRWQGHGS